MITRGLRYSHPITALGDRDAYVGSICDSSALLYLLTQWVHEARAFDLPAAIDNVTRKLASFFSLHDRGALRPGLRVDNNLRAVNCLKLKMPHRVQDLPGGGAHFAELRADCGNVCGGAMICHEGVTIGRLVRGEVNRIEPAGIHHQLCGRSHLVDVVLMMFWLAAR